MSAHQAPDADQRAVSVRIFLGLAAYAVVLAIVYGVASGELAGLALLAIAGLGSFGFATWLHLQPPTAVSEGEGSPAESDERPPYLPTTSAAPLLLGGGATLLIAGIPLGLWVSVPGALVLVWGIHQLIRQNVDHR